MERKFTLRTLVALLMGLILIGLAGSRASAFDTNPHLDNTSRTFESAAPQEESRYTITVHTGNVEHADTRANVYVELIGSSGTSGKIDLPSFTWILAELRLALRSRG
jgi:hypothetical protein